MKRLASILAAAIACSTSANVQLAWNPSETDGVTNYVLYASYYYLGETGSDWLNWKDTAVWINSGTNLTAEVTDLMPGVWTFVATAQKDGAESGPSNSLEVEIPAPPKHLRTVVLQYGVTVTNFQDTGFFKVRFENEAAATNQNEAVRSRSISKERNGSRQ